MSRRRSRDLTIFHGNVAQVRRLPQIERVLNDHDPDVLVLTEAYHLGPWLRGQLDGYRLVQWGRAHGAEAGDVAILVREGLRVRGRRLHKMRTRWYGPFRFPRSIREPRRFPRVTVVKAGVAWPILGVHFPSGGPSGGSMTKGKNAPAWHECARVTRRWLRRRPRAVVVGDLNSKRADVVQYVTPPGALVGMASNVDGLIVKGATANLRRLDSPAGMHGWFLATITPKERR